MMIGAIIWLLVTFNYNLHPFHVSVCEVEFSAKNKSLQITHHIFLDDLEEALKEYSGKPLDIINPKNQLERDRLIKNYIMENFSVKVNGKSTPGNYLGNEMEEDAMYCYIEIKGVKKIKELEITNTIMMSKFEDQVNLVHVNYLGKIRSLKLGRNYSTDRLTYD